MRSLCPWLLCLCFCACAGGGRDFVPESRDVRVLDASATPEGAQGYEYVARRPLALVALAEARGIEPAMAREATDRLADALDACATDQGRKGSPVGGAARLVAAIEANGNVGTPIVRIDPAAGAAESAVMCLVAPARLLMFPPVDAGVRGIAIEALWGRLIPRR
ncbi:MAG TPA: hypothetical protein VN894_11165 [Polyangiaceae bacterium]|nr:hypothetical protein [Polyangiaceae bacterium]